MPRNVSIIFILYAIVVGQLMAWRYYPVCNTPCRTGGHVQTCCRLYTSSPKVRSPKAQIAETNITEKQDRRNQHHRNTDYRYEIRRNADRRIPFGHLCS